MPTTTNQGWTLPTVGASENTWGTELNAVFTAQDTLLGATNATEFAILDGATVTTADLNLLAGLDAAGLTGTELGYVNGVTSAIQTQLDGKQSLDATLTALAGLSTGANKIPYSTGTDTFGQLDLVDEDDMSSDSATAVPTQQSVKAYVDSGHGMVFIESQDASSSSSLDFTGFDASKYDGYIFAISGIVGANTTDFSMRTSTDGGSTYDSGSTDYSYSLEGRYNGGSALGAGSSGTDRIRLAFGLTNDANFGFSTQLHLHGPHLAKYTSIHGTAHYSNNATDYVTAYFGGYRKSAADVDAVRFLMGSGNIASGTITMYGLRNA